MKRKTLAAAVELIILEKKNKKEVTP